MISSPFNSIDNNISDSFKVLLRFSLLVTIGYFSFTPNSTTSPEGISFVFLDTGFSSQNTKDEPSKIIINVVERTFFKMLSFLSLIQSTPFLAL